MRILLEKERLVKKRFSDGIKFKLHPDGGMRMRQLCEEQERTFQTEGLVLVKVLSLDIKEEIKTKTPEAEHHELRDDWHVMNLERLEGPDSAGPFRS